MGLRFQPYSFLCLTFSQAPAECITDGQAFALWNVMHQFRLQFFGTLILLSSLEFPGIPGPIFGKFLFPGTKIFREIARPIFWKITLNCDFTSNMLTHVSFNRTKIGGKCKNSKIQMRHFEIKQYASMFWWYFRHFAKD